MLKLHAFLHRVNILINTAWLTFNPLEIYEKLLKTFWSIRCNIPSRQILVPRTSPKHPIWPSRGRPHLTFWSDVPKTPWPDVPGTSRSDVPGTSQGLPSGNLQRRFLGRCEDICRLFQNLILLFCPNFL